LPQASVAKRMSAWARAVAQTIEAQAPLSALMPVVA
jgi:hypothetical protein